MKNAKYLAIVGCIAIAVSLFARGDRQVTSGTVNPSRQVDSKVCATCHPKQVSGYEATGMGRSWFRPTHGNTVENYDSGEFYHPLSDTHYLMTSRNDGFYQRRWQIGFDGKESNVEELKIDYVVGSGNHARAYLHRTERGNLIQLPLGWYPEKGGHWGMSPGFDSGHPQTRRLVSYECAFCHNAYSKIPAGHESENSEPVFTANLREGINCQRCHGSVERHVAVVHTPGATLQAIRASIVNPARLNSKLQMDVCMQCHLEPTSTAIPSIMRRFNRTAFSYVAGQPLTDFNLYFDHAPGTGHDDKFEIAGSAYRLRKSRCFLESRGALTCETCHNPHQIVHGEEGRQQYSAVCVQCHSATLTKLVSVGKHTAANECTTCHMPKRRTEDVVHVVMTDHLIQRRPPARNLLAELPERHPKGSEEYRGDVVPYYPSSIGETGDNALYLAAAQVASTNNLEKGLPRLVREIDRQQPHEAEFYTLLGTGSASDGQPAKAVVAYEIAVKMRPSLLNPVLFSFVSVLKSAGQSSRIPEILKQATRIDPSDARPWYEAAVLDAEQGRTSGALQTIQKAITLDPDLTGAYTSLGGMLAASGPGEQAEAALRKALNIDPYDATAYDLLGRVLTRKGQLVEALFDFQKATRLRPGYEPHLYDYALILVRLNHFDEGEEAAKAAVAADPNQAEAHELLAGLLAKHRKFPDSASEYNRVLELRPDFVRAHLELAGVLAADGDIAGAIAHLREAAKGKDPAIAEQATRALEQIQSNK